MQTSTLYKILIRAIQYYFTVNYFVTIYNYTASDNILLQQNNVVLLKFIFHKLQPHTSILHTQIFIHVISNKNVNVGYRLSCPHVRFVENFEAFGFGDALPSFR